MNRHNSPARKKLADWEIVAFAYTAFFEARTPAAKAKDQALRMLLDCLAGLSERQIHKEAYKSLSITEIRSLIAHYISAEQTMLKIAHFKNNR